ncbi:MAG: hypothetical protein PHG05_00835 [Candidatus Nanoarchaeia archaeon]|nr:hypothetical protein [Candidatus Nanoarchaeia archaeon]
MIDQINYKNKRNYRILIVPLIIIAVVLLGYFNMFEYIGNAIGLVEFDYKEEYQGQPLIVRFSLNDYIKDVPVEEVLQNNKIVLNLNDYNINQTGDAYVDLIVNGITVDSKKITILETDLSLPEENITIPEIIEINQTEENITITVPEESNITLEITPPEIIELPENKTEEKKIESEFYLTKKGKHIEESITKRGDNYDIYLTSSAIAAESLGNEAKNTNIDIKGAKINENITSFLDKVNDPRFTTDVFALPSLTIEEATITLPKYDKVTLILKCPNFNTDSGYCPLWERTSIPFTDNGDTITFKVNSFSGYVGSNLTVLNIKSYPMVGDNWEVNFETVGQADLTIEAVDGTSFGNDLNFIELTCGSNVITSSLTDGKVYIPNYQCSEQSKESSKVISTGQHVLQITFGTESAKAYNYASDSPQTLNVHGKLTDSSGANINGDTDLIFKIYDIASGGSELWSETITVPVSNGIYSTVLGLGTPMTLPFDKGYYLGVAVSGDSEMSPRVNLTSSPYSFTADLAYNLSCTGCVDWNSEIANIPAGFADGIDDTAGVSDYSNLAMTNDTVNFTGVVHFQNQTILFEYSPVLYNLTNCDTIDTDSVGNLVCGTDGGSGGDDLTNVAFVNNSLNLTESIQFQNQTILFSYSPVFNNLTSCDSIDTDSVGNLVCGTDSSGGSMDYANIAMLNDTANFTGIIQFQNETILFTNSPVFNNLTSCDSIDTDANGNLVCGADLGGEMVYTNIAMLNDTANFTGIIQFQNETILFTNSPVLHNLTSCDSIDTDSVGNLVCGTDATGAGDDLTNVAFVNNTANFTGLIEFTNETILFDKSPVFYNLTSCDSIDTDASGNLVCGTDSGAGDDLTNVAFLNNSQQFTSDVRFQKSPVFQNLTECDTIDTDATGNLVCGTDASGGFDDTAINETIAGVNDTISQNNASLTLIIAAQSADNTSINNLVTANNNSLADIIPKVVLSSDLNNSYARLKTDNTFTLSPVFSNLTSCDTIDTDASGNLVCGTDASGGSMDYANIAMTNDTANFTGLIEFTNETILFDKSPVFYNLTSCDTIDTDSVGNLVCGTDANSDDLTNVAFVNNSLNLTESIQFQNQTILFSYSPVFNNLTSCDSIDTDSVGNLVCGTDDSIGPNSVVNTTHIEDGTITNVDISNSAAIDPSKIVNGTFGSTDDYVFPANLNVTNNITAEGITMKTNDKIYLGDEGNATIYFDGTNLIIKVN